MYQRFITSVGFIFQFYNILPSLTVKENVELINEIVKDQIMLVTSIALSRNLKKIDMVASLKANE